MEVEAKDGKLRLMKNVLREYDKLPYMLIAGGTGGGKTYFYTGHWLKPCFIQIQNRMLLHPKMLILRT